MRGTDEVEVDESQAEASDPNLARYSARRSRLALASRRVAARIGTHGKPAAVVVVVVVIVSTRWRWQ